MFSFLTVRFYALGPSDPICRVASMLKGRSRSASSTNSISTPGSSRRRGGGGVGDVTNAARDKRQHHDAPVRSVGGLSGVFDQKRVFRFYTGAGVSQVHAASRKSRIRSIASVGRNSGNRTYNTITRCCRRTKR